MRRFGTALVVIVSATVALIVPLLLISPSAPCDSDEAHHVALGLKFQGDLATGDPVAFLRHTLKTGRYPFLHGWYVAGAFGLFGSSLTVARATSAVLLSVSVLLAVLLLRRMRPRANPAWGLLLAVFLVAAPENLTNAVLCMREIPGLALTVLGAWLYHRRLERLESRGRALLAGLAPVALLFVKYPFGAYLLLPLGLAELFRVRLRVLKLFRPASLFVWTPALIALGIWLAVPQSRQGVLRLLADAPDRIHVEEELSPFSIPYVQPELVGFYLRTLVRVLSPGVVLGMAGLIGAVFLLLRGDLFGRTVLVGTLLWTMFTLTLSYRTFGVDRFLVPAGGVFAIAAVTGLRDLGRWLSGFRGRPGRIAHLSLLAILAIGCVEAAWRARRLPELARATVETGEAEAAAMTWLTEAVETPANVLLVGCWDQLSEDGLKVHFLLGNPSRHYEDLDVKGLKVETAFRTTARLDRWFETESRWCPPGSPPRNQYVVMIETKASAASPSDPASWREIVSSARGRLAGLSPAAKREDELASFHVYRLPAR